MNYNDKIYVAGHNGMVGSAIVRKLHEKGFLNIVTRSSSELDLTNQQSVHAFLQEEKPDNVVIAAAKVGGIHANDCYPAEFIYQNLMIEANLIHGAYLAGVNQLLFLGSSCIYPKESLQPIKEEYLLSSHLELTNEPYAVAKIAGIKLCESYNRQYGTDYRSIMPTNLYGPNDNFHPKNSHVIPALIRKFHEAKVGRKPFVEIWGSGKPMREFLHVNDMADASIYIIGLDKKILEDEVALMLSHVNIGTGVDATIKEVAQIIKEVVGYSGEIVFNAKMPDGTKRKLLDVSRMENLGWKPDISLKDGLKDTYKWFLENNKKLRE
ncbi:GDP-L-fucose synthase [Candidatus Thioglobus autotrophicus]|uniref:GDP-L-fucose synthase n=1 Tax=Candidatus Thioglobus autotrophicus TaxID=1705394 RepID=UPI00299D47F5|nr:GDP-L-fucose synthase [Candidatus Thioglobus autotrophicus]WPE18842.1 GDP-L-fucose synthase [Candidatus Thioglobus autotrophicus]